MYPERESVERLELDREQDQELLAARGRQEPTDFAAEEPGADEERPHPQEAEDQD